MFRRQFNQASSEHVAQSIPDCGSKLQAVEQVGSTSAGFPVVGGDTRGVYMQIYRARKNVGACRTMSWP